MTDSLRNPLHGERVSLQSAAMDDRRSVYDWLASSTISAPADYHDAVVMIKVYE